MDADIPKIAGHLPHWELIASRLGYEEQDIQDIEMNHQRAEDRRTAFVRRWISENGTNATYVKLCAVLVDLDQQGAAEQILNIAIDP